MFPFDQSKQQTYQQYAQAADSGDYSQVDPNEAAGHVQQFAQNAPPEMQQQVYGQYFQQMPPEQRQQFVQQLPPQLQGQMDPHDPQGMALGGDKLYVADRKNHLLRVLDLKANTVATLAGTGKQGQDRADDHDPRGPFEVQPPRQPAGNGGRDREPGRGPPPGQAAGRDREHRGYGELPPGGGWFARGAERPVQRPGDHRQGQHAQRRRGHGQGHQRRGRYPGQAPGAGALGVIPGGRAGGHRLPYVPQRPDAVDGGDHRGGQARRVQGRPVAQHGGEHLILSHPQRRWRQPR